MDLEDERTLLAGPDEGPAAEERAEVLDLVLGVLERLGSLCLSVFDPVPHWCTLATGSNDWLVQVSDHRSCLSSEPSLLPERVIPGRDDRAFARFDVGAASTRAKVLAAGRWRRFWTLPAIIIQFRSQDGILKR